MDLNITEVDHYVYKTDNSPKLVYRKIDIISKCLVNKRTGENGVIVDLPEMTPGITKYDQKLSDEKIIDVNLETEVKIEVIDEIDDFDSEKYDIPQIIGGTRKNDEIKKIITNKFKEEFVVFVESHDDEPQTNLNISLGKNLKAISIQDKIWIIGLKRNDDKLRFLFLEILTGHITC
jgi:hypothetical protein